MIWAKYALPKHAIIAWMAIFNKLPIKERIKNWGLEVNDVCELCGIVKEIRDHLFYGCRFSQQAWNEILMLCGQTKRCNVGEEN